LPPAHPRGSPRGGDTIFWQKTMKAADLLREAAELVSGPRAEQHGDMHENFENIAELWNAFLRIRRDPTEPLTASQAALMFALAKIARTQLGEVNADDYCDGAAYPAIAGQLEVPDDG
jgi:hypothetical protein